MKRSDRIIGIVLGLVVGIVAVILFVFGGGASSLDEPSIDEPTTVEQPAGSGSGASP